MTKTFEDLVFGIHPMAKEVPIEMILDNVFDFPGGMKLPIPKTSAILDFDNGYGVSVITEAKWYGTYEVAITHNGEICYDTEITSDVLVCDNPQQVTDIMLRVQSLTKSGTFPQTME